MATEVSLSLCSFRKNTKTLVLASEFNAGIFPNEIIVISNHTGKRIKFIKDIEAALRAEFWDGEQMVYIPTEVVPNVSQLVVYHAY